MENNQYLFTLQLNARLQPIDRDEYFEDPINQALEDSQCGTTDGGGTMLQETGEIESCDVEIILKDNKKENVDKVLQIINEIGVPKGSLLLGNGFKQSVGTLEGLALYLNGTELPEEVYETSDINYVIEKINQELNGIGRFYSFWGGPTDSGLYFYGTSFAEMKQRMAAFLAEYPLCQKCRVEQIA
ncbi:hypothetical protein SAMN04487944_12280 [Gracilibacillus ureilyticus]|uniref:Uncharacterized protein n=1 Tax=Gracilibacillus ureilyticus TaxID=531814 RepID=A0A1H9VB59_9BACI|nr:hypothetical protein [Gracilibacillus ureilyticus]SES18798.1 hypothetical protein SAMN04487944_12280 [Gracilibacillus ureilyticus]